jgi:hypothetical protein
MADIDLGGSDPADIWAVIQAMRAEQMEQQVALSDVQRHIDLQRLATVEFMGRSQSSSATLDKFEEVAQSTALAAQQLEAEVLQVRSSCDSCRQAAEKEVSAFRAELEESRSKHYADIAELCASFASMAGSAEGRPPQQTMFPMIEARDQNLRDQMAELLEKSQAALSKNFLEEHRKLLVEVLEERETRLQDIQELHSRLDDLKSSSNVLMGDAQPEVAAPRATFDRQSSGERRAEPSTVRFLMDELNTVRSEVESCLDAANTAVRLGESLTNELHIEVDARNQDVKELRASINKLTEVPTSPQWRDDDNKGFASMAGRNVLSQSKFEAAISAQDKVRFGGGSVSHSPFVGPGDSGSISLPMKRNEGQSLGVLPHVQQGIVAGSHSVPLGTENGPGLMLSGGNPLAWRQHQMPAGDRYLASQRRAQGTPAAAGSGQVPGAVPASLSLTSPRTHSPMRNYTHGLVQRVDMPASQLAEQHLMRQHSSPLREHRDNLTQSYSQHQVNLPTAGSGLASSMTATPGTARRNLGGVQLARSVSPVQRRTTLGSL